MPMTCKGKQKGGDSRIEKENSPIHLQQLMLAPTQAISFDSDPFEVIKMILELIHIHTLQGYLKELFEFQQKKKR